MTLWQSKYLSVRYFCLKRQACWLSRLATWATIPGTPGNIILLNVMFEAFNKLVKSRALCYNQICFYFHFCKLFLTLKDNLSRQEPLKDSHRLLEIHIYILLTWKCLTQTEHKFFNVFKLDELFGLELWLSWFCWDHTGVTCKDQLLRLS